jgi:MFS family permease
VIEPIPQSKPLWSRDFFSVVCAQMAFNYAISTFLLLPKFLSTQLGATPSDIGHVNAIPGLVAVLIVPFVGGFLDRVGRRPLMAAGALLALAYSLAWLGVDRLGPSIYALQILNGLAWMLAFSGSSTLITDLAPPERLSQAIGVFGAANISMNALGPSIAEPTAARFGWRVAFAIAALTAACSLLLIRRVHEPARPRSPSTTGTADLLATWAVARRLSPYLLAMATCGAAFGAVFTFYQPCVLAQGAKQVSLFFVGFTLAAIVTRVGLGSMADRVGRRRVSLWALALYACVVLAMTQLSPSRLLEFGFIFGFAHGFFYPALNALALEFTHTAERGRAMTLINGSFHLGNTTSVVTFGWVAHSYGYPPVFVLASLVTCVGIVTLYLSAAHGAVDTAPAAAEPSSPASS